MKFVTRKYTDEEREIALEKSKLKTKERNALPENIAKKKLRESDPKWKANHNAQSRKYASTPEAKAKRKARESNPEWKEKHNRDSRIRYSRPEVKAQQKKTFQERNTQVKFDVFTHYSKEISNSDVPICACCKYDDIRFLTLDHIDGRKHLSKKEKRLRSLNLWRYVQKIGLPKGYQVLCFNCNIGKSTGLYCPHQLDKLT